MGAVASINNCYNDVCCPKDAKSKEGDNQREGGEVSSFQNINSLVSNPSIDNEIYDNQNRNIFLFENDEFNSINVESPNNRKENKNIANNKNNDNNNINRDNELLNDNNDNKNNNNDNKNNNNDNKNNNNDNKNNNNNNDNKNNNKNNNNIKDSPKSNSSNFSFKCFMKNDQINNELNNDFNLDHKAKINKVKNKNSYNKVEDDMGNINNKNNIFENVDKSDYLSKVIKIQKMFRSYINRKMQSEKKTDFKDDNEHSNGISNGNEKKNLLNLEYPSSKIKTSKNYSDLLLNRHLINIEYIDVSEESFRSVTMKSNKCQLDPPQFSTLRELDIDQIKGYFLLKKKMFKYRGQKDKNGKKVGFGKIIWEDSSKLKGYFTDSKINGIVYFCNCNVETSTFFGEYKDNIPEGYGIYSRKGFTLEGMNWNKNALNDIGVAIWEEGEMYEGEFKNNVKEGIGLYRWADGTTYMGQFQKGKITGLGKMQFANGNVYEGQFNEGYITGWGKFVWDDGKYYIGNYLNNKKDGFGLFVWNLDPLSAVIGFWSQGKQNGVGVRLYKGHYKFALFQESKSDIIINSKWELNKYLRPSQTKYKIFFKKKYNEFAKFIKFASK